MREPAATLKTRSTSFRRWQTSRSALISLSMEASLTTV